MISAKNIIAFIKAEIVLVISLILAIVSSFFIPPDLMYPTYIDFRTLSILLSLMLVMAGLQKLYVFRQIGEFLITRVSSERILSLVLVLLCFLFSMLITNDVALITFVPFTIVVLHMAHADNRLIPIIVLETIAANLGSMMTPMGNPQNLYLYSLTDLSLPAFFRLMLPYGLVALLLILLLTTVMTSGNRISLDFHSPFSRNKKEKQRLIMYIVLFLLSLLVVSRILDYRIGLISVFALVFLFDRSIFKNVDYSLLFTFVFLFIFIGNLKRISSIHTFLSQIVESHEILVSVLASQVISNVPAAILLSGFTSRIELLIIGTNLGGLGTLIASMASLISYKQYSHVSDPKPQKYLIVFTWMNLLILALLLMLHLLIT